MDLTAFKGHQRIRRISLIHIGNILDFPLSWEEVIDFLEVYRPEEVLIESSLLRGAVGDTRGKALQELTSLSLVKLEGLLEQLKGAIQAFSTLTTLAAPSRLLNGCIGFSSVKNLMLTEPLKGHDHKT